MKDNTEFSEEFFYRFYKANPFEVEYDLLPNLGGVDFELRTELEKIDKSQKISKKFIRDILNEEYNDKFLIKDIITQKELTNFIGSFTDYGQFMDQYQQFETTKKESGLLEKALQELSDSEKKYLSSKDDLAKNIQDLAKSEEKLEYSLKNTSISEELLSLTNKDLDEILKQISEKNAPKKGLDRVRQVLKDKKKKTDEEIKLDNYEQLIKNINLNELREILISKDSVKFLKTMNVTLRGDIGHYEHLLRPALNKRIKDIRENLSQLDLENILFVVVDKFLSKHDNPNLFSPLKRLEEYYKAKDSLSKAEMGYINNYEVYDAKFKAIKKTAAEAAKARSSRSSSAAYIPSGNSSDRTASETSSVDGDWIMVENNSLGSELSTKDRKNNQQELSRLQDDLVKQYKSTRVFTLGKSSLFNIFSKIEKEVLEADPEKRKKTKNIEIKTLQYTAYLKKAVKYGALDKLSASQKVMAEFLLSDKPKYEVKTSVSPDQTPANTPRNDSQKNR
jgi:hypothetical protein